MLKVFFSPHLASGKNKTFLSRRRAPFVWTKSRRTPCLSHTYISRSFELNFGVANQCRLKLPWLADTGEKHHIMRGELGKPSLGGKL